MRQKPSFAWHFRKPFCLEIHMGLGRHAVYACVEPFVTGPSVTCTVQYRIDVAVGETQGRWPIDPDSQGTYLGILSILEITGICICTIQPAVLQQVRLILH